VWQSQTPVISGPVATTPLPVSTTGAVQPPTTTPPSSSGPRLDKGEKWTDTSTGVVWTWDGYKWVDPNPPFATASPTSGGGSSGGVDAAAADDASGLGNLFDLFKQGITKDQAVSTIGSLVPTLLNLFLGAFGMGEQGGSLSSIAYDPNLYGALRQAAGGPKGIISFGGTITNPFPGITYGSAGAGAGSDPAKTGEGDSLMSGDGVALPSGGGPGSEAAGIKAATALFNAGFKKRSDLETITAISWRESKWDPTVKNPNTSDRGLMQINMSAHKQTLNALGYGESDLMDIQKNANVAYKLWQSGGGDYGSFQQLWGFSTHSPYVPGGVGWDKHGDPLGRTSGSHAAGIVAAAHLPTVGDVDTAAYSMDPTTYAPLAPVTGGEGRAIMFNNTFNINGGGGGSGNGIDVRRTVTMLADQLEGEMRQRLARSN
jgi:Transglycosylase SLT domain